MTTAEMLADAQAKLHLLLTGRLSLSRGHGYVVNIPMPNPELKAYIRDLQAELCGRKLGGAIMPICRNEAEPPSAASASPSRGNAPRE